MWSTVFFDLDGTISDSAPGITRSVQYALEKEFGIVKQPEELIEFVGPPLKEQFVQYIGCTDEMAEKAVERYRERYRPIGINENSLYPGIAALLQQLYDENFTIVLTSSKPEVFCRQVLENFGIAKYFTAICGSDLEGTRTEKNDVIEYAIKTIGAEDYRDEIVLVGDRKYDIIGAKQCGLASIGVAFGYGSREELENEWPDCIVDSVTELRNVLIGQARVGQKAIPAWNTPEGKKIRRAADGNGLFKIWRVGYPILVHFGLSNLLIIIGIFLVFLFTIGRGDMISETMHRYISQTVLMTGIADAAVIPVGWLLFRLDQRKRAASPFRERILNENVFRVLEVICTAVLVIGTAAVINILISLIPIKDAAYESVSEEIFNSAGFVTQLIVIGILAPVAEEFIFRALVYRRTRDYLGPVWAMIISSLLFGIYHGNLTQGAFAFLMGILLSLLYEHYGTLWAPIVGHIANNSFATIENHIMAGKDSPGPIYYVFSGVIFAAALVCCFKMFRKEPKVNRF